MKVSKAVQNLIDLDVVLKMVEIYITPKNRLLAQRQGSRGN